MSNVDTKLISASKVLSLASWLNIAFSICIQVIVQYKYDMYKICIKYFLLEHELWVLTVSENEWLGKIHNLPG